MNRYLIAALYVMAGCAVAIPLKVQGSPESFNKDRCRLVITNSVKVVSAYLEQEQTKQTSGVFPSDFFHQAFEAVVDFHFFPGESVEPKVAFLCLASHRIRAPEPFLI